MGSERKIVQNAVFRGKRHDNKISKVQILLSRNFVVIAQAPSFHSTGGSPSYSGTTLCEDLRGKLPLGRFSGASAVRVLRGLRGVSAGLCGGPWDFPRVVTLSL